MNANESRAQRVSFNSLARGGLVNESFALLSRWDFSKSRAQNFAEAEAQNYLGIGSHSYLCDLLQAIKRRLLPDGRDRALTILVQNTQSIEIFRPCLLWHLTLDEFLLRDFLIHWLFVQWVGKRAFVRSADLEDFVRSAPLRGAVVQGAWAGETVRRACSGLTRMASDFGLLSRRHPKHFLPFMMRDEALIYLLHAIAEREGSPAKAVLSEDWRMFLMGPGDIEHELFRLHQFRKLEYYVAGSLIELSLPCANPREYAERMVA